jgi:cellulose synthase/poly-beta-1,6-N-acetylglucosamine synthase-like glycosyltransferase
VVPSGLPESLCLAPDGEQHGFCPARLNLQVPTPGGRPLIETADVSLENLAWLRAAYPQARIVATTSTHLFSRAEARFGARIADDAVHGLARMHPSLSARTVLTRVQGLLIGAMAIMSALFFALSPLEAFRTLVGLTTIGFITGAVFRVLLAWIGGVSHDDAPPPAADDDTLPAYTILVPLYREANVVPALVRSLVQFDYPRDKLDIKLIVESDDDATVAACVECARYSQFHIVRVPPGAPRTKPRACNYAFAFARGEFTVIFDAEDRPEPDQLRKAVAQFRSSPCEIACLQARLNFYNANENWLTRLFALDYALRFDLLLPGLERLRVPMPLGGTSNHFRTSALRTLGAWDPFNVTEDADVGIRLAQMGMRVAMLDSTTFEEAPTSLGAWLKQRSRWLKGYMQTWLVHMRDPVTLCRRTGWRGLISLQLFLGGAVSSALLNPLLLLIFVHSCLFRSPADNSVTTVSAAALLIGNAVLTWLAVIAPRRRGWKSLAPYGFTVTFYWALVSIAAWRALWQLATRPFYWEKTAHGVTTFEARSELTVRLGLVLAIVAGLASLTPSEAFAGAWTLKKHHWQTFNATTISVANASFGSEGRASAPIKFRKLLTQNTVEYGLIDDVTLFATPAYVVASQASSADKPIKAAGSSFEAGARILLLTHIGKLSFQTSYKAAGPFDLSDSANHNAARQIEVRLLYGTSYKLFGFDGFADAQAAQRWINRGRPDETAIDLTAGLWFRPNSMVMAQSFNIVSGGDARAPFTNYRSHKFQLSFVERLSKHWSLQVGGFLSPAGQNALVEKGLSVVFWTQR